MADISLRDAFRAVRSNPEYSVVHDAIMADFPYRIPKTHTPWESLSAIATLSLSDIDDPKADHACRLHGALWSFFLKNNLPVYCLSNELLRSFQETDSDRLPRLIPEDWLPPFPVYLLLLPQNSLQSPIGNNVAYMMVTLHDDRDPHSLPSEYPRQIAITFFDNGGNAWVSGLGLDKGKFISSDRDLGRSDLKEGDLPWLREMIFIALQASITISYMPELVESDEQTVAVEQLSRFKPSSVKSSKLRLLNPRWIGKNFKRRSSPPIGGGGGGGTKSPHWRRWHWRTQHHGPKNELIKVLRIDTYRTGNKG